MATVLPAGQPCVGIVYARLVVQGEDRGVRPFVVQLNDGKKLTEGISVMCVNSFWSCQTLLNLVPGCYPIEVGLIQ
jgi:hypothetical protein